MSDAGQEEKQASEENGTHRTESYMVTAEARQQVGEWAETDVRTKCTKATG